LRNSSLNPKKEGKIPSKAPAEINLSSPLGMTRDGSQLTLQTIDEAQTQG